MYMYMYMTRYRNMSILQDIDVSRHFETCWFPKSSLKLGENNSFNKKCCSSCEFEVVWPFQC